MNEEEIYSDALRPLDLCLFAKSSESRDTFSRLSNFTERLSRASTPIHLSTSRYTYFSPNFSGKVPLKASNLKESARTGRLKDDVEKCLDQIEAALRRAEEIKAMLPVERRNTIEKLTQQVDEEIRQKRLQTEHHKSMLVAIQDDLQAQLRRASKTESNLDYLKAGRTQLKRVKSELEEELSRAPAAELMLTLRQYKEFDQSAGHEFDTRRQSIQMSQFDEKFDDYIASKISRLAKRLPKIDASQDLLSEEDLELDLGLFDNSKTEGALEALRSAVSDFAAKMLPSQRPQHLNKPAHEWESFGESYNPIPSPEVSALQKQIADLKIQHQSQAKRLQAELNTKERDYKRAIKQQQLDFEKRLNDLQNETIDEVSTAKELLHNDYEQLQIHKNYLKLQVENLEEELVASNKQIDRLKREIQDFESVKERIALELEHSWSLKLDHAKRVFSDQYEELGRTSNSQISTLENQLAAGQSHSDIIEDAIRCRLGRDFEIKYAALAEKQDKLHTKEVTLLKEEYEDFVLKAQAEISRLTSLVESCLATGEASTLRSSLHNELNSVSRRLSGSLQQKDSREPCRRCGKTDFEECRFHPYLCRHDCAELLYTSSWHKCREEGHTNESPGCAALQSHSYRRTREPSLLSLLSLNGEANYRS